MTRQQHAGPATAKQLRYTAEAIEFRSGETIEAIEGMTATLKLLGRLAESCRERATALDGKPHNTPSSKTEPKDEAPTL